MKKFGKKLVVSSALILGIAFFAGNGLAYGEESKQKSWEETNIREKTHWALVHGDYDKGHHFISKNDEGQKYWVGIKALESENLSERGLKITVFNLKSGEKIEFFDRDDDLKTGYVELGKVDGIEFGDNNHATGWGIVEKDKLTYWVNNTGVPKEYHEFKSDPEQIIDNLLKSEENMEFLSTFGHNNYLEIKKGAEKMDKSLKELSDYFK